MPNIKWKLSGLYSHLSNRTFSVYWQARKSILNLLDLQTNDVVLEVGCGAGGWTAALAPKTRRYYALDIHFPSLLNARHWKSHVEPYAPVEKVHFFQASGEDLPFRDNAFTKIVSNDVIEHIPDHYKAVQEMNRVLKMGGRAVLTTLLADRPHYVKRMKFPDHVREYTTESLKDLFIQAGMRIDHVFYFYYFPTMVTRELQMIATKAPTGVDLALSIPLTLFGHLENTLKVGKPGGIGIAATKITG